MSVSNDVLLWKLGSICFFGSSVGKKTSASQKKYEAVHFPFSFSKVTNTFSFENKTL